VAQIIRHDIPVDDAAHLIETSLGVVHVGCVGDYETVQLWTLEDEALPATNRYYKVYGTDQPLPKGATYIGTALAAQGAIEWHLFDITGVIGG
jgi:hypothetical protein